MRLNYTDGFITPTDIPQELERVLSLERDRKLKEARHCNAGLCAITDLPHQSFLDACSHVTLCLVSGRGYSSAEVQPQRRPMGQDRSPGGLTTAWIIHLWDWHQRITPSRHDAATFRQDVCPSHSPTPARRISCFR
jgi:hypothetical protein